RFSRDWSSDVCSSDLPWTALTVWLLKLGIRTIHSRPYHPQGRGKNERFHRSLKAEVFAFKRYRDLDDVQRALDEWRAVYNLDRPHEALDFDVPASRYRRSEEHTSELQSREKLVCRLLLEKKKHCDDDIWPGHE